VRKKPPQNEQRAVALEYSPPRDRAPRVIAKGRGEIARKILDLARAHGIPMRQDPDLLEVLFQVELEREIPAEVYPVVAEILAFLYSINATQHSRVSSPDPAIEP